jgi:NlpE N-terminal domain
MSFRPLIGAVLLACSAIVATSSGQEPAHATTAPTHPYVLGTFVGTMPCADCPGISVKLTLYSKSPGDLTNTTYRMELVYQGKNVKPFVTNGNWAVLHGMPGSPTATIYQLNPDKPGEEQNFLRLSADALKELNRDKQAVDSPYNPTLKRVASTP